MSFVPFVEAKLCLLWQPWWKFCEQVYEPLLKVWAALLKKARSNSSLVLWRLLIYIRELFSVISFAIFLVHIVLFDAEVFAKEFLSPLQLSLSYYVVKSNINLKTQVITKIISAMY